MKVIYWITFLVFSIPTFGLLFLFALLGRSEIAEPIRFVLKMHASKGTKIPGLFEAAFRMSEDEVEKWRKAFVSLGWFVKFGPRTTQTLSRLSPPLDISKEFLVFVAYDDERGNHIQDIQVDKVSFRQGFTIVIATDTRIIFIDADNLQPYAFPYDDLSSIEKPEDRTMTKEIKYMLHTKSGHIIQMAIRLDAPNLVGLLEGFHDQAPAGQVTQGWDKGKEVIRFFNLFFTRIVSW